MSNLILDIDERIEAPADDRVREFVVQVALALEGSADPEPC